MSVPNKAQLQAFGGIIHHYAAAEFGIKLILSGMLEIEVTELLILTEPYSSLDLRNVAKSIAKSRFVQTPEILRFLQLVGDLGTFGALRNNIAHSRWTSGDRRGSIKPHKLDIRSGSVKFVGAEEDERDWTTKELEAEADRAFEMNRRITQFIRQTGIAPHILPKQVFSSEEIDASEGSSSNPS
jgi:hypothetical protein